MDDPFEHHHEIEKKMLLRGWHLPEKATPFLSSLPSNESQLSKNSKVRTKDLKQGCFGGGGPNKHKQESLSLWCGLLVGEYTNFLEKKSHSIRPLAQGRAKNSRSSFLENG
jgi:hypothetical protein